MTLMTFQDIIDKHPLASEAYEFLDNKRLIFPGSIIPGDEVERCLKRKYSLGDWSFIGPFLLLKNLLEASGYFISQQKIDPPGFKILSTDEMAEYAMKKLTKNLASNFKVAYIMAAHDTSLLKDEDDKKYKKVQQKAAQTALIQQKMLFTDKFF